MRRVAWIWIAIAIAIAVVGCSENRAATAACRSAQNGPRCSGCCSQNGASTGILVQGVCSCR
jgi:hypothetical protein